MTAPARASIIDVLAARAASDLLFGFSREGILDALRAPRSANAIARAFSLDSSATKIALEYLCRTTDVVVRREGRYAISRRYADLAPLHALLEKQIGAYGPVTRDPVARLRAPRRARLAVDMRALARAYRWDRESPAVVQLLRELRPGCLLDVGCGRGALLASVCEGTGIRGIGVDPDPAMFRAARATVRERGLGRQIQIRRGALGELPAVLSSRTRAQVSVIYVASALNALCRDRDVLGDAIASLARWFPGRMLVAVDYLSEIGRARASAHGCLTDLVQALSGQGVPPPDHRGWGTAYARGGGLLVRAYEGKTNGLRWFIHLVQLATH